MFEEILQLVKEHLNSNPEVAAAIPAEQQEAIHNEIASHIHENIQSLPATSGVGSGGGLSEGLGGLTQGLGGLGGSGGGLLSQLESSFTSGGTGTNALIGALAGKFNLPPAVTGAIAGALPGLLQKLAHRSETPGA